MKCKTLTTAEVCLVSEDGQTITAIAHYTYGLDMQDAILLESTRFTDATGNVVYDPADFESIKAGNCEGKPECVESQEWTYGLDNTGTNYRWADATYQITLSDGSTLEFSQSAAANGGCSGSSERASAFLPIQLI